tara:strand:- start:328 stop:573 length:246 start_codon:yes stop_codon:yes gene_type:complete
MSKKKNVNEGIVDKIVTSIFYKIADGMTTTTLDKIQKTDPKLAKSMAKVVQAKKEMESHLSKADLSKIRRGELPAWMDKYK